MTRNDENSNSAQDGSTMSNWEIFWKVYWTIYFSSTVTEGVSINTIKSTASSSKI